MKVLSSSLAAVVPFALFAMTAACGNAPTPSAPSAPNPAHVPAAPATAPDATSVVDAADRSADDRALDAGRKPKELLAFLGVTRGMKVGEIAAGNWLKNDDLPADWEAQREEFGGLDR